MKTDQLHSKIRLMLLALVLIFGAVSTFGASKYALIVSVGNQPSNTHWKSSNANRDANIAKEMYKAQGFDSLIVMTDEQATKALVVEALTQARRSLRKGDVFVFHYSGHGQQLEDNNQDDIDGLDEALVLYGAPSEYDQWYRDENHLRDDEFSSLVDRIRSKLGERGEVLIVTDAGFGALNTLGTDSIRGGVKAMVSPGFINRSRFMDVSAGIYEDRPFGMPSESFAPIITISASQSHQVSYEYQGGGALTRALERCLENLDEKTTYEKLFSKLSNEFLQMNLNQMPVIDGFYDVVILRNAKTHIHSNGMSFKNDFIADMILHSTDHLTKTDPLQNDSDPRLKSLF